MDRLGKLEVAAFAGHWRGRFEADFRTNLIYSGPSSSVMRKDYRFLIGQRFAFGGAIYVVEDLTAAEDRTYVKANPSPADLPADGAGAADPTGTADIETFTLADVLQWLLVEEEIELFNPNYLAAR